MKKRVSEYPVNDLFLNRWSPRAMSGESIQYEELMALFEAARWAPSSFNNQPWRFIYAMKESQEWKVFFDFLNSFNQMWAVNASALIVVISAKNFEFNNLPSRTHSHDAGAACQNFALQASLNKLVVRGIEGFDYDKARLVLNIPDSYDIEMMFAVGRPGNVEDLPERFRAKEYPSDRKPLSELIFEGKFK